MERCGIMTRAPGNLLSPVHVVLPWGGIHLSSGMIISRTCRHSQNENRVRYTHKCCKGCRKGILRKTCMLHTSPVYYVHALWYNPGWLLVYDLHVEYTPFRKENCST